MQDASNEIVAAAQPPFPTVLVAFVASCCQLITQLCRLFLRRHQSGSSVNGVQSQAVIATLQVIFATVAAWAPVSNTYPWWSLSIACSMYYERANSYSQKVITMIGTFSLGWLPLVIGVLPAIPCALSAWLPQIPSLLASMFIVALFFFGIPLLFNRKEDKRKHRWRMVFHFVVVVIVIIMAIVGAIMGNGSLIYGIFVAFISIVTLHWFEGLWENWESIRNYCRDQCAAARGLILLGAESLWEGGATRI